MTVHRLKTDPEHFDAVKAGTKTVELRFDDRDFCVGDTLELRKTRYTSAEMREGALLEYLGAPFRVRVTHITRAEFHGLLDGWVAMSIQPLSAFDQAQTQAVLAPPVKDETDGSDDCICLRCIHDNMLEDEHGMTLSATRMIVCGQCGNKRCPRASDHRNDCTQSNKPGQPGSDF